MAGIWRSKRRLLMDAYKLMSHELHRMQVEEEMLMRKYYEFMTVQESVEKKASADAKKDEEPGEAGAMVVASREEQS